MKALVLAAGLGTRLRPLTLARAKPALPVLGIPAFWFGAWHLAKELSASELAINMSHLAPTVRDAAADQALTAFTGVRFHFSDESDELLGSSGALWKLRDWIGSGTLAVCNGDSICFPPWKRMLEQHRRTKALITMHVRAFANEADQYTDIKVADDGRITALAPKAASGVMFDGPYLFEPELLARLPAGVSELRPTLLEPLMAEGKLYAVREDIPLIDVGTVASYARAQFELLRIMPQARPLVEAKMREENSGVWVPRDWKHASGKPGFTGPVVMTGNQEEWACHSIFYGPHFVGIEPPPPGAKIPNSDALVLSAHVQRL